MLVHSALRVSRQRLACQSPALVSRSLAISAIRRQDAPSGNGENKASIANIAQLRKLLPGTTMVKAREALNATANVVNDALQWLEKDLQVAGAKKASKVSDREAKEGGVAVCIITDGAPSGEVQQALTTASRAGIVELNCETDFVGRNEIFQQLLADLAHTVALFPTMAMDEAVDVDNSKDAQSSLSSQDIIDIPVQQLLDFPLIPRPPSDTASAVPSTSQKSIGEAILDVISRLGERVHLARASSLGNVAVPSPDAPRRSASAQTSTPPWFVSSAFTHGGASSSTATSTAIGPQVFVGRVGSLLLTRVQRPPSDEKARRDEASLKALRGLTRSLARQAAGMPTRSIRQSTEAGADEEGTVLYDQPFIMKLAAATLPEHADGHKTNSDETVEQSLQQWSSVWLKDAQAANKNAVHVVGLRRWQLGEQF